jgi:hypothetical protein
VGERLLHTQEVGGSKPPAPTTKLHRDAVPGPSAGVRISVLLACCARPILAHAMSVTRIFAVTVLLAVAACEAGTDIGSPDAGPMEESEVRVPSVLGMTRASAIATLRAEGFDPVVRVKWMRTGKDGRIMRQGARGIDRAPDVLPVLTVRRRLRRVPDLGLLTVDRARRALRRAGFRMRIVKRVGAFLASFYDPGTVMRTRPDNFNYVRPGALVTVVVKAAPISVDAASGCSPSYSGCVPIASDVDCAGGTGNGPAYVGGPVYIQWSDPYGLDADNDGVGCEETG